MNYEPNAEGVGLDFLYNIENPAELHGSSVQVSSLRKTVKPDILAYVLSLLYAEGVGLEPTSTCARHFSRVVRYQFRAPLQNLF